MNGSEDGNYDLPVNTNLLMRVNVETTPSQWTRTHYEYIEYDFNTLIHHSLNGIWQYRKNITKEQAALDNTSIKIVSWSYLRRAWCLNTLRYFSHRRNWGLKVPNNGWSCREDRFLFLKLFDDNEAEVLKISRPSFLSALKILRGIEIYALLMDEVYISKEEKLQVIDAHKKTYPNSTVFQRRSHRLM